MSATCAWNHPNTEEKEAKAKFKKKEKGKTQERDKKKKDLGKKIRKKNKEWKTRREGIWLQGEANTLV